MSLTLPSMLRDDIYNGMWEWENGWPVAKDEAPQELKDVLAAFKSENQNPNSDGEIIKV